MSLFTVPDTVPSRVLAVYRYLLRAKGQRESREALEHVLMPEGLPLASLTSKKEEQEQLEAERGVRTEVESPRASAPAAGEESKQRGMISRVVRECVSMGLLVQDGDEVMLSPGLPEAARDPKQAEALAPLTLCELIMHPGNESNHDMARAIAWYLAFDPQRPPTEWDVLDVEYREEVRSLNMNNSTRYGQLREWGSYLGFTWTFSFSKTKHTQLIPDPTEHLRLRLPRLFTKGNVVRPFGDVLAELAGQCGVFEGGRFRRENENAHRSKPLEGRALTRASAHAWLRLQEEGMVELSHASDADAMLLPEEEDTQRYSQVRWLDAVRR
ncbi:hypothetical protein D7Y23_29790 [Corallococcus sp. AB050B]|nr:hypothetical protein D7Y23_29790 [Corallococcus sp. AB050B]